jgi:hypothetical protein
MISLDLRRTLRFALMVSPCLAWSLEAQSVATVRGIVTNEAARPLEQALVTLDPEGANRQVRTDREGRFNFLGVPAGSHTVRVTWVGFAPETRQFEMTGTDVTIDVTLRRLTYLDTVAVTAKRTGLYGSVIAKDSLLPVPNARVEIIGARRTDSTNSSGTFNFPDLKPGSYVVRVKHSLFQSRNFGVVIPVGGGTELDVVVERGSVSRDQHMEMLYREMDTRLTFRGTNTAFVPREVLKGREKMQLDKALLFAPEVAQKALYWQSDVCLFVDGIARPGMNLSDFASEDIESVELYAAPGRSTMVFQRGGNLAGTLDTSRTVRQADPSGSLLSRWPPKTPCGREPMLHEQRVGATIPKVLFAVIWTKQP